ncbi:hypothetical protein VYU27_000997 [Nannochloropsis oceanica]
MRTVGAIVIRSARSALRTSSGLGEGVGKRMSKGPGGPSLAGPSRTASGMPSASRGSSRMQRQYEFGMALRRQAMPACALMLDAAAGPEARVAALYMGGGLDDDDGT